MGFDLSAVCMEPSEARQAEVDAAFQAAHEEAHRLGRGAELFLSIGSLSCSLSKDYFFDAVGRSGRPPDIWLAEEVATLGKAARWRDVSSIPPDELWGYWSARKFLDVCVMHTLAIWFI